MSRTTDAQRLLQDFAIRQKEHEDLFTFEKNSIPFGSIEYRTPNEDTSRSTFVNIIGKVEKEPYACALVIKASTFLLKVKTTMFEPFELPIIDAVDSNDIGLSYVILTALIDYMYHLSLGRGDTFSSSIQLIKEQKAVLKSKITKENNKYLTLLYSPSNQDQKRKDQIKTDDDEPQTFAKRTRAPPRGHVEDVTMQQKRREVTCRFCFLFGETLFYKLGDKNENTKFSIGIFTSQPKEKIMEALLNHFVKPNAKFGLFKIKIGKDIYVFNVNSTLLTISSFEVVSPKHQEPYYDFYITSSQPNIIEAILNPPSVPTTME